MVARADGVLAPCHVEALVADHQRVVRQADRGSSSVFPSARKSMSGLGLHLQSTSTVQQPVGGGRFEFVWLPARMPHGAHHVERTCGELNEIKKSTHPENVTALFGPTP